MRLDYFEDPAADPPRVLLLHELTPAAVGRLRRAIGALVAREDELRVEELTGIESELSLSAVVGTENEGVLRVGDASFRCVLTRAGWERVVTLLGPFAEPLASDSFQYLIEAGDVEWIVSTSGRW